MPEQCHAFTNHEPDSIVGDDPTPDGIPKQAFQMPHDWSSGTGTVGGTSMRECVGSRNSNLPISLRIFRRVIPLWASAKNPMIDKGSVPATNATNEKPVAAAFVIPNICRPVM